MKAILTALLLAPVLAFGGQITKTSDGFILPDGSRAYKTREGYSIHAKDRIVRVTKTRTGYLVDHYKPDSKQMSQVFDAYYASKKR